MHRPPQTKPITPVVAAEGPQSDRRRDLVAMLTSATLHAILLVLLAFWVLPTLSGGRQMLEVSVGDDQSYALETMDVSADLSSVMLEASDRPAEVSDPLEVGMMDFILADAASGLDNLDVSASLVPTEFPLEALSTSSSVEGAVDRITAELHAKLDKDDLLVIWLLDASNSLVDDRQRVAARLTPFYEDIVSRQSSKRHKLLSAVVSYGTAMRERVGPTPFGEKIVNAVGDLPVDRTGNEKVFDAVAKCAQHYRQSWDKQIAMVIWTDESGDDLQNLEASIKHCRENQVSVSVVGPSSVLGAETGLHSYTDPKTNQVYQVPVRRGPETPMSERIELGYWYLTWIGRGGPGRGAPREGPGGGAGNGQRGAGPPRGQGPPGEQRPPRGFGGRRGVLPSWLGGQDLEGILSGFSPYALTRLSIQTGGSYTIFDRPEDRGPYDPVAMQRYAPSYGTFADYTQDLRSNPLRTAVIKAVDELKGKKVDAPPTMLFVKTTGPRWHDFMRYYYPPMEFQSKLRSSRGRLVGQAARYAKVVEAALRHLSSEDDPETGLDDLYKYETSPRWRAWYLLTRGRLLATSVRLEEYRLTVNAIAKPGGLAGTTNHVRLAASEELRSDSKFRARAEEANQLLDRCITEHRDTPWEMLARRERDYWYGVGAMERSLTPGPISPEPRQPNLPRF